MSPEKLATIREWATQESGVTLPAKTVLALLDMAEPLEAEAVRRAHKLLVRDAVLKERQRCLDIVGQVVGRAVIRRRIEEGP